MARILLGQGAYERFGLPVARMVNRYFETAPTTSEQTAIRSRPGLVEFADVGAPIIALYRQPGTLGGLVVAVTANAIYSIDPDTGDVVGTTPALNLSDRVSMTSGPAGVMYLTDGAQLLKLTIAADETTITATAVPFPDFASCSWVAYLGAYFLFGRANSQRVYRLAVGDTVITDYFSAEMAPDNLRAGIVLGDTLYLLGESTVELWSPTGLLSPPFQRQPGLPVDFSCAARDAVQKVNNALYYPGADGVVYEAQGLPQRISDAGIEQALQGVPFENLRSWQYEHQGHKFYCLDTGTQTLAFDVTTRRWSNLTSYGADTFKCKTSCPLGDGRWLAGDSENGKVYVFEGADDAGDPIIRTVSGIVETPPARCTNVVLQCSVGQAPDHLDDPLIELRHSDDLGETWTDYVPASLGRLGEYSTRVAWWQRGMMSRVRLFEFRDSNPVETVIRSAGYNETVR